MAPLLLGDFKNFLTPPRISLFQQWVDYVFNFTGNLWLIPPNCSFCHPEYNNAWPYLVNLFLDVSLLQNLVDDILSFTNFFLLQGTLKGRTLCRFDLERERIDWKHMLYRDSGLLGIDKQGCTTICVIHLTLCLNLCATNYWPSDVPQFLCLKFCAMCVIPQRVTQRCQHSHPGNRGGFKPKIGRFSKITCKFNGTKLARNREVAVFWCRSGQKCFNK